MTNEAMSSATSHFDPEIDRPDDFLSEIESDDALRAVLDEVRRHMDLDPAHDLAHLLRVARWTVRLVDDAVDHRLAIAAALLHDIINIPKTSPERPLASERSADFAREFLPRLGFGPSEVELAAGAIRDHSFTRGAIPESLLGRALQDADRLDALGVIGTFRSIAMGAHLGLEFVHATDPWATERELDDGSYSVDHFFKKLLRLPETFRTEAGRVEARRRAEFMRLLLAELGRELDAPAPWAAGADATQPAADRLT
ncbi:MAG TPA: HD domain-containing protein [Gemmatimonadaceae bacterium]|nr:HD domain-containing protein [Gemmatimonadaceae bacterium]